MTDTNFELFDDFAARFARGEGPDVRDYLRRAGSGADELAALIDSYLTRAQPPAPDEESIALARAFVAGEPALLELRKRRGIRVDEVIDAIVGALGVDAQKRAKVKSYYQQLEGGVLEPRGVDASVWDVLARKLGASVRELRVWRPRSIQTDVAFFRG